MLKLLRAMLRAGVMEDGDGQRSVAGTPQGGVVSPLLGQHLPAPGRPGMAEGRGGGAGALRRRSGGVVPHRKEAVHALEVLTAMLADLGLEPKRPRPGSCIWRRGGGELTSSAFTTAGCGPSHPGPHVLFLARWPSERAMKRIPRSDPRTHGPARMLLPVEGIVET